MGPLLAARCTAERLDDDQARATMAAELDLPYDDPPAGAPPFHVVVQPLLDALDQCLTPEELGRLDWN